MKQRHRRIVVASLVFAGGAASAQAQRGATVPKVTVQAIAPSNYLVSDSTANLVVYAAKDASLAVGVQAPGPVARTQQLLRELRMAPVRYALGLTDDRRSHVKYHGRR